MKKSEQDWKKIITPEQYKVMREKGTEPAFSCNWKKNGDGIYECAACSLPLFRSDSKFESGTGWPSYFAPLNSEHIEEKPDYTFGVFRTEVICARCESHLGHVFDDLSHEIRQGAEKVSGPLSVKKRYCINSISLKFIPKFK